MPQIRRIILAAMNIMVLTPSSVIFMKCHSTSGSPEEIKKRLSMPVKIIIGRIGFIDLSIIFMGMPEMINAASMYKDAAKSPVKPDAVNSITIYMTVRRSFILGSRRWIIDFPGKNWPIVMSLIKRLSPFP